MTVPATDGASEHVTARSDRLLLAAVFVVATCGLVYELIAATMASYLLGDSVTQFSLVIGVYLSAMGLGSWLSKFVDKHLHARFVQTQLVVAVVGGSSAAVLFLAFSQLESVRPLLFGTLTVVGTMVGLEIPLLMRIMQQDQPLKNLVARVLAYDYLGALAASVLFPLALLPHMGLVRTSLLFGVMNAGVALYAAFSFGPQLRRPRVLRLQCGVIAAALTLAWWWGDELESLGERELYDAPVVFSKRTPYQRLTLTRWRDDVRLYIDGNLQFSSIDEYRYHEALVHPVMAMPAPHRRVLVLGGGDGLAVRELLRYRDIDELRLVDLDPDMTKLFREHPMLRNLNAGSLSDPRVDIVNTDAMQFLQHEQRANEPAYDIIVIDLPDPNNFSLGKLYTQSFYRLVHQRLHEHGALVVQATSPFLAPRAFWCIVETIASSGYSVHPYHAHVPSFGDWGYVLATPRPSDAPHELRAPQTLRFLDDTTLSSMFVFPRDQAPADVDVNRLNDQLLVHYYEQDLASPTPWLRGG